MNKLKISVNDEALEEICELYWSLEEQNVFTYKISEIANKFNVSTTTISNLVKKNCVAFSDTHQCYTCSKPLELTSRAEYNNHLSKSLDWQCDDCYFLEKEQLQQKYHDAVYNYIESKKSKREMSNDLNLKECVYLLAFIRHCASENLDYFFPLNKIANKLLTPNYYDEITIISFLLNSGIIQLSHQSPIQAFYISDNFEVESNFVSPYNIADCYFEFADCYGNNGSLLLTTIEQLLDDSVFISLHKPSLVDLIQDISLCECIDYLVYRLNEYRFPVKIGDKTKSVLKQCLDKYSVAEIYSFIYSAVKNAAAYYTKGNVSKQQAANSVIGNIQTTYERSLSGVWFVNSYQRISSLPQSTLSQVLFNTIFKKYDVGFNQKINELFKTF